MRGGKKTAMRWWRTHRDCQKKKKRETDECAIAVDRGGQTPRVLQRGDFGVQRRRAALYAQVVTHAELFAGAGEQRGADGYAPFGAAAFGFFEGDGEAVRVVDRVASAGAGASVRRRLGGGRGGRMSRGSRRGRGRGGDGDRFPRHPTRSRWW